MLAEPPPTQADLCFQLLGFPVRNPSVVLVGGAVLGTTLLVAAGDGPVLGRGRAVRILLHELGHAVVMRRFGFQPHIVLHGFGGLTSFGPRSGFGPRLGPWGQILISAAGPATGFLLAAILVTGLRAAGPGVVIEWFGPGESFRVVPQVVQAVGWAKAMDFINIVLQVSVLWGLLNLLPILPLDGGQIAEQIFLLWAPRDAVRQSLVLSLVVAGFLAVVAAMQWHNWYLALFFGYLAYSNYRTLGFYGGHGRWQ